MDEKYMTPYQIDLYLQKEIEELKEKIDTIEEGPEKNVVLSVQGKTGNVHLTASDIGARSNSWTPTYDQIRGEKPPLEPSTKYYDFGEIRWNFNGTSAETFLSLPIGFVKPNNLYLLSFYLLDEEVNINKIQYNIVIKDFVTSRLVFVRYDGTIETGQINFYLQSGQLHIQWNNDWFLEFIDELRIVEL